MSRRNRASETLQAFVLMCALVALIIALLSDTVPLDVIMFAGKMILGGAVVLLILLAVWRGRRRRHYRDVIMPLHWALVRVLNLPEDASPKYIHVPRSKDSDEIAAVYLPRDFIGDDRLKTQVQAVMRAKLQARDVDFMWSLHGHRPFVQMTRAPRPPDQVLSTDPRVVRLLNSAKESAPLLGIGTRGHAISVDLDSESPHILVSAGTGGFKSSIMRAVACQCVRNGAYVSIMDVKRTSQKWAVGLRNVHITRDIADIHNELLHLQEIREGRAKVDEAAGLDNVDVGQRIVIMVEEGNTMISELKRYWNEIKERGDSSTSPAISALRQILLMGRTAKMHVLGVFQLATASDMGGPVMREQFFVRILSRYSLRAWNMLSNGLRYIPASRHPGRVQVIMGDTAYETQVILFTEQDARAWAQTARDDHVDTSHPFLPRGVPGGTGAALSVAVPSVPPETQPLAPVTLREASETNVVTLTVDALRKAALRDPKFPASVGMRGNAKTWNVDDLANWEAERG